MRRDPSAANAALESCGVCLGRLVHDLYKSRGKPRFFFLQDHGQGEGEIRLTLLIEGDTPKLGSHILANYQHNKQIYGYQ